MKKRTDITRKEDEDKPLIRISVRNLVEFLLRSGDIDSRLPSGLDTDAMLAGSRVHKKIQKRAEKRYTGQYSSEVTLQNDTEYDELILRVEGRADGILDIPASQKGDEEDQPSDLPNQKRGQRDGDMKLESREAVIDEIKGMYLDVTLLEEPFPLHLAQAKCYAAMYAEREDLTEVSVRLIYVNLDTEETQSFLSSYYFEDLKTWFADLVDEYEKWAKWQLEHKRARDVSMKQLEFPFPYREGQKKLTAAVYHTIKEGKQLFLMAPTGTGKTMSCVFAAVRAVGEGLGDRIFYLTAKNETLRNGMEAFKLLQQKGLNLVLVRITSKEKVCPMNRVSCNPDDCPYAKGHFDRINEAVFDFISRQEILDANSVKAQSEAYRVCPYELAMDVSGWADAVLGDYNYVFDPNARLRKFFGEGADGDSIFLIDEAHNLVDRGREMYSASLVREHTMRAKRQLGQKHQKQAKALDKISKILLEQKHELLDGGLENYQIKEFGRLDQLEYACLHAYEAMQTLFRTSKDGDLKEKLLDFYFELGTFCSIFQNLDESYVAYTENRVLKPGKGEEKAKTEFSLTLYCVNPAGLLTECMDKGRAAVLFSATLLPLSYFKHLLTTGEAPYAVYVESPFPAANRRILVGRDVSTRYKLRGADLYRRLAAYIAAVARAKTGNYLVFFPSYQMLRDVFRVYREEFDTPDVDWVLQTFAMGEADRDIFMENFYEHPKRSLVAFAVMGGMFSEGIDLTGDRLIGAIVVGAGLPQVSSERDIIRQYFDGQGQNGFAYAYLYPGMNKVEQAAGRVIRTAADRGVILLLDDRFLEGSYRALFPREWTDVGTCTLDTVGQELEQFWDREEFDVDRNR